MCEIRRRPAAAIQDAKWPHRAHFARKTRLSAAIGFYATPRFQRMTALRQKRPIRNGHSGESKKQFVARLVLRQRDRAAGQQNLPKADILEKSVFDLQRI